MLFFILSFNIGIEIGDTVSVLINRLSNKPDFLKTNLNAKKRKASADHAEEQKDPDVIPEMTEKDLPNLEVSEGSFI